MQRVNGVVRWSAFALATYTLSLFFAGWREVNTSGHWTGFLLLAAGVILTSMLLLLQGYWIYFEEKNKGTLKRSHKLFDAVHAFIEARFPNNRIIKLIQPVIVIDREGNNPS